MVVEPAATPVTTPVTEFTVAILVLPLLQPPPIVPVLVYGVVEPAHTVSEPLTIPGFGSGFIVMLADDTELPHVPLTV